MMVCILATSGKTLSELIEQLPKRIILKDKITTPEGDRIIDFIKTRYPRDLLDETDGVKIHKHNSWILVRASGTEPIVRIIIDSGTPDEARELQREINNHISQLPVKTG
jgi:phosphomannomutase / phosphoglucomutase